MFRRHAVILAAALLAFSILPPAAHASPVGCVSTSWSHVGEGVGVYLDHASGGILAMLAAGAPGEGVTLALLIAPELCVGGGLDDAPPIGGLPPLPDLGQSTTKTPLVP